MEVTHLREVAQDLRFPVDALNNASSGVGIILGNVVMDVLKPTLCFLRPIQLCLDRMRSCIS